MILKNARVVVKRIIKNSNSGNSKVAQPKKKEPDFQDAQTAANEANTTARTANDSFTNVLNQNTKSNISQASQNSSSSNNSSSSSNIVLPSNIASILAIATTTTTTPISTSGPKLSEKAPETLSSSVSSSELSLLLSKLPLLTNTVKDPQTNLKIESTEEKVQENLKPDPVLKALAPLDLPSNPIVYSNDLKDAGSKNEDVKMDNNNNTTNFQDNNKNIDTSRLDEKAKLELILQNTMNQTNNVYHASKVINNHSFLPLNNKPAKFNGAETVATSSMVAANVTTSNNNWMLRSINRIPPPNYLCTICKIPGHYKNFCPEAGNMELRSINSYENSLKTPKGIPKSFQVSVTQDHPMAMRAPDGNYVVPEIDHEASKVIKKDRPQFMDEDDEINEKKAKDDQISSNLAIKFPSQLKCPYGDHIIRDAVLIPCCGHFVCCDVCIREKISNEGMDNIQCPHKDCNEEIGSLASITPFHEMRKKVTEYLNDMKVVNQRITSNAAINTNIANDNDEVDPFFDLILNDVTNDIKSDAEEKSSNFDKTESKIIVDSLTKSFDLDKDDEEIQSENDHSVKSPRETNKPLHFDTGRPSPSNSNSGNQTKISIPNFVPQTPRFQLPQTSQAFVNDMGFNSQAFTQGNNLIGNHHINSFGMNQNFQNQSYINQNKIRNRFPLMPNNGFGFQPPRPNNFITIQPSTIQQIPPGSMPNQFANSNMTQTPFPIAPQMPSNVFPNQLHPFPPNVLQPMTGPIGQIYNAPQFGPTTSHPMPQMIDTSKFPISQQQTLNNPGIMSEAEFYKYQEHLRKEKSDLISNKDNRNRRHESKSRRNRSRSRTRSRSSSRSRSNKRKRSYSRSRSRSRSRSYNRKRSYSRSRSRSRSRGGGGRRSNRYRNSRSPRRRSRTSSRSPRSYHSRSYKHKSTKSNEKNDTTNSRRKNAYSSSTRRKSRSRTHSRSRNRRSPYNRSPGQSSQSKHSSNKTETSPNEEINVRRESFQKNERKSPVEIKSLSNSPIDLLIQPKSNEEVDQSNNSQIANINVNEISETNHSSDLVNEVLDIFSLREFEEGEECELDSQDTYDINIISKPENKVTGHGQDMENSNDFMQRDLNCLLDSPNSQNDSYETQDIFKRKNSSLSENSINEEENITKIKNKPKKVHKSKHETIVA